METKVLLNEGKEQALAFQMSVNNVITKSNELIDAWNTFQDFQQISSYDIFYELISDPVAMLDKLLINAVDIKIIGKSKLNPKAIADMLTLSYESWISIVEGKPVATDCISCRKIKVKKGEPVITLWEFQRYEKYIAFQNGRFVASDQAVKEKQKTYQVFAESPEQTELYNYWHNVCDTLNSLFEKGYLGSEAFKTMQKSLNNRLLYSYETNRLHISEEPLMYEILKLK